MNIKIYSLPNCRFCAAAKLLLESYGKPYQEIDGKHPEWPTAPGVVIDDRLIGGFTELARESKNW
jgi:glutaredoxin